MKVEFSLFGSEREMALEIIPETLFEKTFIERASKYGAFTIRQPDTHVLLMLDTRLTISPEVITEGK